MLYIRNALWMTGVAGEVFDLADHFIVPELMSNTDITSNLLGERESECL